MGGLKDDQTGKAEAPGRGIRLRVRFAVTAAGPSIEESMRVLVGVLRLWVFLVGIRLFDHRSEEEGVEV